MDDKYVTHSELSKALEKQTKAVSKALGDRMEEIMTTQTNRLLKVLKRYDEEAEKHERNFVNIKKAIE